MKKLIMVLVVCAFVTMLLGQITTPIDTRLKAPVEFDIKVSNDEVYVGDSIDVHVTVTLSKDHPDYEKGIQYEVIEVTNYRHIPGGMRKDSNPLWEVLFSDKNTIIDDNNPVVEFHYIIKLNKLPVYKSVGIMTPKVVEVGEMGIKRSNRPQYMVTCLNEGLPEKSMRKPGDIKFLKDAPIQNIIDVKLPQILIEPDSIKPYNDSTINKKERDSDYYNYLIMDNYYITFALEDGYYISSVDCPLELGEATK